MKLAEYLTAHGLTPEKFADELGVDAVSVRRYMSGARRPRWSVMAEIAALTGGKVTANDFVAVEPKRRVRPSQRVSRPACSPT
jgi:transcriptional regulator with XRE-family HTH domain